MAQVKQLDFTGTTIFCGVDVHKNSWRVNIQDSEFELEDFSQDADAVALQKHLLRKYPNATYKVCYEAGFCGFGLQRYLSSNGIDCSVINAADVATTNKEKRQKNDKIDARKLCEHLQSKKVKNIYVPTPSSEHCRSLVRARLRIVSNQTRCKNRIWQLLHFSGLSLPKGYQAGQYWSKNFVKQLQQVDCGDENLQCALTLYINDFISTRDLLLNATRSIRKLCRQKEYANQIRLLKTVSGIGEINAAIILFEIQDIKRFPNLNQLCSYAGLIPDTGDSGETKISKGITTRKNQFLRVALVESSWKAITKDPALLMMYKNYCKNMSKNKAIIRMAKHLLARIRYVLKNEKEYVARVVK